MNLEDFVWSLNKNLEKTNNGEASGEFSGGVFTVTIMSSSMDVVKSYIEPFVRSMRKHGAKFILNARQEEPQEQEHEPAGQVKGKTVNRKALLTKMTLLDCSLDDATDK